MITIAIAAVLVVIAVPSFQNLMLSNRLTTSANAMVGAINQARMDAIKLNAPVQFCGSNANANASDTLGTACGTNAGAVYSLPQGAATAGEVRVAAPGISGPLQLIGGVVAVRFSGQGLGYAPNVPGTPFNGTIATICTARLGSNNQRFVRMTTGSTVAVASSTGACP